MASPILQYKFISTETITSDSMGNFDSIINSDGTSQVSDVGVHGTTCHFDGNTRFELVSVPTTLTNNSARSIAVWIYITNVAVNNPILSTTLATGKHLFRYRSSDQKVAIQNAFNGTVSTSKISANTWTHIGVTYDGSGTASIFVNGSLSNTNGITWDLSNNDMKYLGGNPDNGEFFHGNMVDFRVYDQNIGSTGMASLYSSGPDLYYLSADPYTHIIDLTWHLGPGATNVEVTKIFNSTTSLISSDTLTQYARITDVFPGETHTFTLSVGGVDVQNVVVTLPNVDQTSVTNMLVLLENDVTSLSEFAMDQIKDYVPPLLTPNDILTTRISDGRKVYERDDISVLSTGSSVECGAYLLPFSTNGGPGQSITLTPESTLVSFDETTSTIYVNGMGYSVGDKLVIGSMKASVFEMV